MSRSPLKQREAVVRITAYDGFGHVLGELDTYIRLTPSVQLLDFMMDIEVRYPNVTRYEMTIAY